ncbi:hypothetical protein [Streptomyces sp. AS02]|uniref:hypothetical protein n=1 Tax=Streptomyces sp. AS02 TaxID=2938946 RepID=UPI0020206C86|nr:hypothetical protein [Streptomyces sp. AS02]MCL8016825.1 hypothetical protein [Streptomyces sp. AS02]
MQEIGQVPGATDGADFRRALKDHYGVTLKRFLKTFPIFAVMCVSLFVTKSEYLIPLAIIGMFGSLITAVGCYARLSLIWRCSRVFRAYPVAFRGPIEKMNLERYARSRLRLRFGEPADQSTTMLAKSALGRYGWPAGIEDGVWFAGDDPFGGVAIVPSTGELLFMQPSEWMLLAEERESAGEARIEQARRAGIRKAVSYR